MMEALEPLHGQVSRVLVFHGSLDLPRHSKLLFLMDCVIVSSFKLMANLRLDVM